MLNSPNQKFNVDSNPIYLSALGLAPLVAISKSLITGFFIGSVFCLTLVISALVISSIRAFVPHFSRLAYILIISSACVSALDLITQAMFYQLNLFAGIYLPLIAMNGLVLFYLEAEALKYPPRLIIKPLVHISGLVFIISILVGAVREILSQGGIFLDVENISTYSSNGISLLPGAMNLSLFNTASGAFIITGCILALINIQLKKRSG